MLERIPLEVFSDPQASSADPVLDDLRDRCTYRRLLARCKDALEVELKQGPDAVIGLRAAATDVARRSVRTALSGAAAETIQPLLEAAYQELQLRLLKRGGNVRRAEPAPERPTTLIRITNTGVTQLQRTKQNLIAAAILSGQCIPDPESRRLHPISSSQPKKHPRWLEAYNDRLTNGAQQRRLFKSEADLIWRYDRGQAALRLRIVSECSAITHTFETICCLLRPEERSSVRPKEKWRRARGRTLQLARLEPVC